MSLVIAPPPQRTLELLRENTDESDDVATAALVAPLVQAEPPPPAAAVQPFVAVQAQGDVAPVDVPAQHPIYTVPTEAFRARAVLEWARLTAWQFVKTVDGKAVEVSEISANATGADPYAYAARRYVDYAQPIADTVAFASGLAEVQNREYELRILRAPGVWLVALWLHATGNGQGGEADLLLPIAPVPAALIGRPVLNEETLTELLRPLAEKRLVLSDLR
jgi:hypothetical protein